MATKNSRVKFKDIRQGKTFWWLHFEVTAANKRMISEPYPLRILAKPTLGKKNSKGFAFSAIGSDNELERWESHHFGIDRTALRPIDFGAGRLLFVSWRAANSFMKKYLAGQPTYSEHMEAIADHGRNLQFDQDYELEASITEHEMSMNELTAGTYNPDCPPLVSASRKQMFSGHQKQNDQFIIGIDPSAPGPDMAVMIDPKIFGKPIQRGYGAGIRSAHKSLTDSSSGAAASSGSFHIGHAGEMEKSVKALINVGSVLDLPRPEVNSLLGGQMGQLNNLSKDTQLLVMQLKANPDLILNPLLSFDTTPQVTEQFDQYLKELIAASGTIALNIEQLTAGFKEHLKNHLADPEGLMMLDSMSHALTEDDRLKGYSWTTKITVPPISDDLRKQLEANQYVCEPAKVNSTDKQSPMVQYTDENTHMRSELKKKMFAEERSKAPFVISADDNGSIAVSVVPEQKDPDCAGDHSFQLAP